MFLLYVRKYIAEIGHNAFFLSFFFAYKKSVQKAISEICENCHWLILIELRLD